MAVNHTARMVKPTEADIKKDDVITFTPESKTQVKTTIQAKASEQSGIEKEPESIIKPEPTEDEAYKAQISDLAGKLDLEEFFFSGEISHTFQLSKKASVTIKVLSASELQETQSFMWGLRNEDISAIQAEMKYALEVLSRAVIKYGKKDLTKMSLDERREYLSELPSMVVPLIFNKYSLLERAATEALKNPEQVKN